MNGIKWLIGSLALTALSCQNSDKSDLPLTLGPSPVCLDKPVEQVLVSGSAVLGSDVAYPEERTRTKVTGIFNMDATEVTNAQFAEFISETNYVTDAERIQPLFGKKGGTVFTMPTAKSPQWWSFVEGSNWKHPEGPTSSIAGRDNEPVVQVSHGDAKAYAKWAGRKLPTEEVWELAAKAGSNTLYVWGEERAPNGVEMANTWQGAFPIKNSEKDGYFLRAPVGCYEPNKFGLYDMIGNVWEWTDTIYKDSEGEKIYTIKGGSFLCSENYCRRYRSSARQPQEAGLPTNHIGFRTYSE